MITVWHRIFSSNQIKAPLYTQSVPNLPAQGEGSITGYSCHNDKEKHTATLDFQITCSAKKNCRQNQSQSSSNEKGKESNRG